MKVHFERAFGVTVRAHRGGGYAKDHVYLTGFLAVRKYVAEGGDLRLLFVGKCSLNDVPLVRELLAAGKLKEPQYYPW